MSSTAAGRGSGPTPGRADRGTEANREFAASNRTAGGDSKLQPFCRGLPRVGSPGLFRKVCHRIAVSSRPTSAPRTRPPTPPAATPPAAHVLGPDARTRLERIGNSRILRVGATQFPTSPRVTETIYRRQRTCPHWTHGVVLHGETVLHELVITRPDLRAKADADADDHDRCGGSRPDGPDWSSDAGHRAQPLRPPARRCG